MNIHVRSFVGLSCTKNLIISNLPCNKIFRFVATISMDIHLKTLLSTNHLSGVDNALKSNAFNTLYKPIYQSLRLGIELSSSDQKPFFVGLSAPQGCGKTTLVEILRDFAEIDNLHCVTMSLDDFYLTGSEQDALAERHSHNTLLQYRGNAGTHDLTLLSSTLQSLAAQSPPPLDSSDSSSNVVLIPRYDKSLRGGRGDRVDASQWTRIEKPADIVLVEGWMFGFTPLEDNTIPLESDIMEVNEYLKQYEQIHMMMDTWIVLAVNDIQNVYKWRLEAEHRMKSSGRTGMTDEQVHDFVSRFMPAYHTYLPTLYAQGPQRRRLIQHSCNDNKSQHVSVLKITVDEKRMPIDTQVL